MSIPHRPPSTNPQQTGKPPLTPPPPDSSREATDKWVVLVGGEYVSPPATALSYSPTFLLLPPTFLLPLPHSPTFSSPPPSFSTPHLPSPIPHLPSPIPYLPSPAPLTPSPQPDGTPQSSSTNPAPSTDNGAFPSRHHGSLPAVLCTWCTPTGWARRRGSGARDRSKGTQQAPGRRWAGHLRWMLGGWLGGMLFLFFVLPGGWLDTDWE